MERQEKKKENEREMWKGEDVRSGNRGGGGDREKRKGEERREQVNKLINLLNIDFELFQCVLHHFLIKNQRNKVSDARVDRCRGRQRLADTGTAAVVIVAVASIINLCCFSFKEKGKSQEQQRNVRSYNNNNNTTVVAKVLLRTE